MAFDRGPEWGGAAGPVALVLELGEFPVGVGQPLLSAQGSGGEEIFFLVREDEDHFRLGFARGKDEPVVSEPFQLETATPHRLVLSSGVLMPGPDSIVYRRDPRLFRLREVAFGSFDGRSVLILKSFAAAPSLRVTAGVNAILAPVCEPFLAVAPKEIAAADPVEVTKASTELKGLLGAPIADWDGYPGPVELKVLFPIGKGGAEPLLVSGRTGAGDFLYVRYVAPSSVQLGFDHWGQGGSISAPVEIDYHREHVLKITLPSLVPPAQSELYVKAPKLNLLRALVRVELDGNRLLSFPAECHPAAADEITLGINPIGGSTTERAFSGQILSVERVEIARLLPAARSEFFGAITKPREAEWLGFPGPLQLFLTWPPSPVAGAKEVLLSSGVEGRGDVFFIEYQKAGYARIGWDHWGSAVSWSGPFPFRGGEKGVITLSSAGQMPPPGTALYQRRPELEILLGRVTVDVDGKAVLRADAGGFSSEADQIAIGANFIGGSVTRASFSGTIDRVEPIPSDLLPLP